MTATILGLSVDDFYSYWLSIGNFTKAVIYDPLISYNENETVFFNGSPYISLVDNNSNPPLPTTDPVTWNQIALGNQVLPGIVASSMQQAQNEFNPSLISSTYINGIFVKPDTPPPVDTMTGYTNAQQAFIILTSHYIVCNIFANNFQGQPNNVTSSNSVNGISQSFMYDSRTASKNIFDLNCTEYGRQYKTMTAPLRRSRTAPFMVF